MLVNLVEPFKATYFPTGKPALLTNEIMEVSTVGVLSVVKSYKHNIDKRICNVVVINTLDQTILLQVCVAPSLVCMSSTFFAYAQYLGILEASSKAAAKVVVLDARNPQSITTMRLALTREELVTFGGLHNLTFVEQSALHPTLFLNDKKLF
jgi:hypothetical protein